MKKPLLSLLCVVLLSLAGPAWAQTGAKVLFEGAHAQTAGNADWVMDEDSCGTAQRPPTPAQSGITASTPETYWSGAFSSFGVDLVKKGFQVESLPVGGRITYGDGTNSQDLSNYKVFILPEPNVKYTTAEKSAILSFVRNGGGVFMIADHEGSDRNSDGYDATEVFNDLWSPAPGASTSRPRARRTAGSTTTRTPTSPTTPPPPSSTRGPSARPRAARGWASSAPPR